MCEKDKEISNKKKIIEKLKKDVNKEEKLKIENKKLKKDLEAIRNSLSFRLGRQITYLPRKLRGGIRCYKEHGLIYTVKRFKEKVLNKLK